MSFLHNFCKKARYVTEKTLEKTGELIEGAALGIKIKAVEMRLDEQYAKLGALLYRRFQNNEEGGEQEAAVIAAIDELNAKLEKLKKDGIWETAEPTEENEKETEAAETPESEGPTDGQDPT